MLEWPKPVVHCKQYIISFICGIADIDGIQVALECGPMTELYSIEEPGTCVYVAKLKTPIACHPDLLSASGASRTVHDEL